MWASRISHFDGHHSKQSSRFTPWAYYHSHHKSKTEVSRDLSKEKVGEQMNSETSGVASGQLMNIPRSDFAELPTNVSTQEQLDALPDEYKSGDPAKPLQHIDEDTGEVFKYSLNPTTFAVVFILSIELLERFSYYGLVYTQTSFLTGQYSDDWSAEMTAIDASSYVSIGVAVAYTTPFLGAVLSDAVLGDFRSIVVGALFFYIPGLLLIDLTTVPYLLGDTFNITAFLFALLVLWPIGTGTLKSVINVFGARQHHPILQSALIESFYVRYDQGQVEPASFHKVTLCLMCFLCISDEAFTWSSMSDHWSEVC